MLLLLEHDFKWSSSRVADRSEVTEVAPVEEGMEDSCCLERETALGKEVLMI